MTTIFKNVLFRYETTPLTSLVYDSTATNQKTFNCIMIDYNPNVAIDKGRLMNGKGFAHSLYNFLSWDISIGADEIDQTNLDFLSDFWTAGYKYILPSVSTSYSGNYKLVGTDGGKLPVERLDDLVFLKEIKFNFEEL
jgi:hypothetical protein